MALGDLVVQTYQFEYNGLLLGVGTPFDVTEIRNFLGFRARSETSAKFGRHGGVKGRHYSDIKNITIVGNVLGDTDTDFETQRRAIANAFDPTESPDVDRYLVTMLPGASSTKVIVNARPIDTDLNLDRSFSLKYPPFSLRIEAADPRIYGLTLRSQSYILPTATHTLVNAGNALTNWKLTLVGPAINPVITNNDTGQSISFTGLTLLGSDTLVIDSANSTVLVNNVTVSTKLSVGFQWWNLKKGNTSITVAATDAELSSCMIEWRDGYWIP